MKTTLLTILAFAGMTSLFAQVPQIPLVEHFTQASCGPCASQNPALKATMDAFGTANYVRVSHQTSWPGVDPMNAAFPAGPNDRRNYYNITAVPQTSLNGGMPGSPNTVVTSSSLASAFANTTPYDITVTHTWADPSTVNVNIDVENVTGSAISTADKIYVTMVENQVVYPTAPGSNGETSFEYVMRQMYNASTGAPNATSGAALGSIAANSTTNFSFTISNLPSYIRDKTEVTFAVYIQNNGTKAILQAGKSDKAPVPGIISVSTADASTVSNDFCDYNFTPAIDFTNNDAATAVTSVVAEYSLNGGTPVQQTYSGNLTNGQTATISFPMATLSGGANTISSQIISVNGGQDWSSPAAVAIADRVVQRLNVNGTNAPILEGMENGQLLPSSGYTQDISTGLFSSDEPISNFAVVDGPAFNLGAIGGFAASNRSLNYRFYNVSAGGVMDFIMQKINLGTGSSLTFSHAYRQYTNENDRLEVSVSTDCGVTWTSVFDQSGSTLSTLTPSTTQYIPSVAGDWRSNNVDLSAYDNTNDLILRFRGTSGYGNNLWLDDINIQSTLSHDDINALNELKLYPNPTSDMIQITGLNEAVNFSVYNVLGAQVIEGTISQNESIDVENFTDGVYFLKLENGKTYKFIKE
ncbi:T9SS type A sorting domain-containing protein [Nonlabens sp.]|uniref:T9SS type A sorting domain-containing protein n=1 Tax=Nonlabens sp. TaxID=1888209 RepID=UPI003F6A4697